MLHTEGKFSRSVAVCRANRIAFIRYIKKRIPIFFNILLGLNLPRSGVGSHEPLFHFPNISYQSPPLRAKAFRSRRMFPTHFCVSLHPSITRQTEVGRQGNGASPFILHDLSHPSYFSDKSA